MAEKKYPVIPVTVKYEKSQRMLTPDSYGSEPDFSREFEELTSRTISISCEYPGVLIRDGEGGVRLEYHELDGSLGRILWREEDGDSVTVLSDGTMLVLDRRRRWPCSNLSPLGPIDVVTETLSLSNTLMTGGELRVRYRVSLHTVTVEESDLYVSLGVPTVNYF